ncbi:hypothetical protein SZN_02302 [Streptomyces zinciresistens K42]|uniref:Uncharacterized protein n=1 Tax=Streptomyces zinciresistens K42 TaxID=700597 RepID=G2G4Q7_9ACTN|nr:hypothetical protein [Streptomyces zinciresistens]EGX61530.1 hypothetical protein SZN_02302 [Streptomyces zinciresistens K42]
MSAELVEIRKAFMELSDSLKALRNVQGDSPYVRRLMNDLDRFQLDMEENPESRDQLASMTASVATLTQMAVANVARDVVRIQEGSDHNVAWRDADDEGIGGHRR